MNKSTTLQLNPLVIVAAIALAAIAVWLMIPKAANDIKLPGLLEIQRELTKAQNQIKVAIEHSNFALQAPALNGATSHAKHVLNVLVGKDSTFFDPSAFNPGNGIGVENHLRNLQTQLENPDLVANIPNLNVITNALTDAELNVSEAIKSVAAALGSDNLAAVQDELGKGLAALLSAQGDDTDTTGLLFIANALANIE